MNSNSQLLVLTLVLISLFSSIVRASTVTCRGTSCPPTQSFQGTRPSPSRTSPPPNSTPPPCARSGCVASSLPSPSSPPSSSPPSSSPPSSSPPPSPPPSSPPAPPSPVNSQPPPSGGGGGNGGDGGGEGGKDTPNRVGEGSKCEGNDHQCSDNKCVKDPRECNSDPPTSLRRREGPAQVDNVKYEFEPDDEKREVLVDVSVDKQSVGTINIPPNTFQSGWKITITSISEEKQKKLESDSSDCEDDSSTSTSSASFQITITNKKGEEVKIQDLPKGITIQSLVEVDDSISQKKLDKMCIGYSSKGDSGWRCLGDTKVTKTKKKNVYYVTATTDHLTSFGVFFDIGNDGCSTNKAYWIASLALLGSFLVFGVLVIIASYKIPAVTAFIGGYHGRAKSMKEVEKEIARRTGSSSSSSSSNA